MDCSPGIGIMHLPLKPLAPKPLSPDSVSGGSMRPSSSCRRRIAFVHPTLGYEIAPPITPKVAKRNARERNRVKQVNSGFDVLRNHIPSAAKHKKMSKVETLRHAVEYIDTLQRLLQEHEVRARKTEVRPTPLSLLPQAQMRQPLVSTPVPGFDNNQQQQQHYFHYPTPLTPRTPSTPSSNVAVSTALMANDAASHHMFSESGYDTCSLSSLASSEQSPLPQMCMQYAPYKMEAEVDMSAHHYNNAQQQQLFLHNYQSVHPSSSDDEEILEDILQWQDQED